jgi:hypothetical protein
MRKIPYAAWFNLIVFGTAALYTLIELRPALRLAGVQFVRYGWLLKHPLSWQIGGWLWLLAIFAWMVLLVVLSWSYLPAHRVATMLQNGLMISAAPLVMAGVSIWMAALPVALAQPDAPTPLAPLVDALALGLLGAGLMLSGVVTTWIAIDLWRQALLARPWLLLPVVAGLLALPSPLLLPNGTLLLVSFVCWLIWCGWLAIRPRLPPAFAEWP